jgi:choline kinase
VQKVSGSMTNAVFFVYGTAAPTLLLRIYGPSSGNLISRPRELHTLHILSSKYGIGPRVYGTFENGRIEEYFDSTTLTAPDLRDPEISRWIGARMAELHSVDADAVEGHGWEIAAKKNILSWLSPASDVLALENMPQEAREAIDIERFKVEWESYLKWLSTRDDASKGSRRVFSHNDAQYGNLLRVKHLPRGLPEHRQVREPIDFIYFTTPEF